jgi:hypothetical protein
MKRFVFTILSACVGLAVNAQESAADSVLQHIGGGRLTIGGYGEANFSRNYFSDHVSRYSQPEAHKDDPSHGRFDIPHAVIFLGYDFGKEQSLREVYLKLK